MCHGILSPDVVLREGNMINMDVSTIYKGYFSDSSRMFCIGEVSPEKKRLVDVTKESLNVGLEFHEEPWVSYVSERGTKIVMSPGMRYWLIKYGLEM